MSLLSLPDGILFEIAELYLSPSSIRCFHETNKRLSKILTPVIDSMAVQDDYASTALYYAAIYSNEGLIRHILTTAVNLNIRDNAGPLHGRAQGPNFNENLIQRLLSSEQRSTLVVTDNRFHATPLHWAAKYGSATVTKTLLESGVNVNARERNGGTALGWAAYNGSTEVIQMLLGGGADFMMKDRMGQRALHYALAKGKEEAVDILKEARRLHKDNEQRKRRQERAQVVRKVPAPATVVIVGNMI